MGAVMTQQYIMGEFSALLSTLEPEPEGCLADAARGLRHRVESAPPVALAPLAAEAVTLADMVCWASLERGDAATFVRNSEAAARLHEFAVSAQLLP